MNMRTISNALLGKAKVVFAAVVLLVCGTVLQSCDDDNNGVIIDPAHYAANALVTVKPVADRDSFYMQLDDATKVYAVNIKGNPYGDKEFRAFANLRYMEQPMGRDCYAVFVNWMDSILTKPMAADLGSANLTTYRQDPVEIMRDWTVSEDGYLTIHFRTRWAGVKPHIVNLAATNGGNPYEVTFFHNAQGEAGGIVGDGYVAFRLDKLPDTKGKTVDLTLKWKSYEGDKSVTFKYCTRKSSQGEESMSISKGTNNSLAE